MTVDATQPSLHAEQAAGLTLGQRRIRVFLATGTLLLLAWAAGVLDIPVSRWCVDGNCPRAVRKFLNVIEPFGNGLGVPVVLAAVWFLDRSRRRVLPRLLACAYLPGLMANAIKLTVLRTRPYAFDFQAPAAGTFGEWFPLASAGSAGQSFPSAHTATAVGLAVGLAWAYPRARSLFASLAALVACQRVVAGYHFPSDVLAGGAIGLLIASSCTYIGVLRRLFRRIERGPQKACLRPLDPPDECRGPAAKESHETLIIRRLLSRAA